ncbi:hypothetical protein ACJX0J_017363, partial [Zea mays]
MGIFIKNWHKLLTLIGDIISFQSFIFSIIHFLEFMFCDRLHLLTLDLPCISAYRWSSMDKEHQGKNDEDTTRNRNLLMLLMALFLSKLSLGGGGGGGHMNYVAHNEVQNFGTFTELIKDSFNEIAAVNLYACDLVFYFPLIIVSNMCFKKDKNKMSENVNYRAALNIIDMLYVTCP